MAGALEERIHCQSEVLPVVDRSSAGQLVERNSVCFAQRNKRFCLCVSCCLLCEPAVSFFLDERPSAAAVDALNGAEGMYVLQQIYYFAASTSSNTPLPLLIVQ